MNRKNFILIGILLALAGFYVIHYTGWFRTKTILISSTTRPVRGRPGQSAVRLYFGLDGDYELTEVKVVPLAEFQTNKLVQSVWHLVSGSGSDDVNRFFYGENIRGMDPAVEGARAEPLQPGVTYRIFIAAGKIKGWHDFEIKSR